MFVTRGSFIPDKGSNQKVKVVARYPHSELVQHGVREEELGQWENASIMISCEKGAALLSMFHPYYGSQNIDVERYEKAFPDCGTDWRDVHSRLSSTEDRMNFATYMLDTLESLDFND